MNIIKNLKNPRRGLYAVYSSSQMILPVLLAKLLAIGNHTLLSGAVNIPTYDGSGQACHPTVAAFQGRTYMACTPFPYGYDYYENPSLYVREDPSQCWRPVPGAFPLVRPQWLYSEYYSDPCLFQRDGKLILLFRKSERRPKRDLEQLYTVSSLNGTDWTAPRLLTERATECSLLSPAVVDCRLFCVECEGENSNIVCYALDELDHLGGRTTCGIEGLDQDFFVWHIDCAIRPGGATWGLFMLREKNRPGIISKLALFAFHPEKAVWSWEQDLPATETEQKILDYVYKSCFTENPTQILCSARDRQERFFLYEKAL